MNNNFLEITQAGFNAMQKNLSDYKEGFDLSMFINKRPESKLENGIGFVNVFGPLVNNAAPIDKELGNTDYADIIADTEQLIADGAKAIVYIFSSPGGAVNGCIEVAEYVASLNVPTVGFVKNQSCSASYKINSSCDWIVASKSSEVGNIGSILCMLDDSRLLEASGLAYVVFTNEGASLKGTGVGTLSEAQTAFLQEKINSMGESFQNHVLNQRPNLDPIVFDARWESGDKAVALGLVDEIGSLSLAIQRANELIELSSGMAL